MQTTHSELPGSMLPEADGVTGVWGGLGYAAATSLRRGESGKRGADGVTASAPTVSSSC